MKLLLRESARTPFRGSVIQLGRQSCTFQQEDVEAWAPRLGARLAAPVCSTVDKPRLQQSRIDDRRFFGMLGFDEVVSCDAADYEGADFVVDLNLPISDALKGRFDAVMDVGTSEHVFSLPQLLANLHAMLKPDGRIVHFVPVSNQVDHGFYSFSPTLFYDYYSANKYAIETALVLQCLEWGGVISAFEYSPGPINQCFNCFDPFTQVGLMFVARKTADSSCDRIPMQGAYASTWSETSSAQVESTAPASDWRQVAKTKLPGLTMATRIAMDRVRHLRQRFAPAKRLPFLGYY